MASSYPPPPPPPPSNPTRSNDTLLAVVIGIVLVIGMMAGFGAFVVHHFVEHSHIVESGYGAQHHVEIRSPLGNLKVDGSGDNAKVDINSPFGSIKVTPTPDLNRFDMSIYPGAEQVQSTADSPFHHDGEDSADSADGLDPLGDLQGIEAYRHSGSTGAHVQLSSGKSALDVDVAEFRTPAPLDQVIRYYDDALGKYGAVSQRREDRDTTTLQLKLAGDNVRAVAIRSGADGTHFVLIRVLGNQ